MSMSLGISPSVMINRIADRSGAPQAAWLGKVAELQGALEAAKDNGQLQAEKVSPSGEAKRPIAENGHFVDMLV